MKNYIQGGATLTVLASAAVTSGAGLLVGTIFGVANGDAANGASVNLVREGVFDVAKVSAQAWTQGQKIYWDNTAKLFTSVATSNIVVGAAVEVAANPSAIGIVLLDGVIR